VNSRLWEQKIEKHEIQKIEISLVREVREIWRTTSVQGFEGQGGKFIPYTPFDREPMELFEKFI